MIVIMGSNRDDILYFETILKNKKKDTILGRYEVSIGTIFNQEVLLISEQYTSLLTGMVLMNIMDNYFVDLVFVVGKCVSVDKRLKCGDIVISNKIIDANVNLVSYKDVRLAEIPGFNREFIPQSDLITYLNEGLNKKSYNTVKEATFLSSDDFSEFNISHIGSSTGIFGNKDDLIVLDFNSSGAALAASLKDVPYISIKVVERKYEQDENVSRYLKVLENYSDVGRAVVSTIGDIGRNDILKGGRGYEG